MAIEKFQFLQSLSENLRGSANVKTVYGEPIQADGKTIIPVARVAYGLGGGYGKVDHRDGNEQGDEVPVGQGGGGGVTVNPIGVFEVTQEQTRFIPLGGKKIKWAAAFFAGFVMAKLMSRKKSVRIIKDPQQLSKE
jgi:uncharacterized spore protein YtfJ